MLPFPPYQYGNPAAMAPGFIGPLDFLSSTKLLAWSSAYRLFSTYIGSLFTLRADRTGQPTQAIGYIANGQADAASATSFLGADLGYFTTLNEQAVGTNNFIQTNAASQPKFEAAGFNSGPCMLFDGSNDGMITTSGVAAASSWWGYVVNRRISAGTNPELWALVSYPDGVGTYRLLEGFNSTTISYNNSWGTVAPVPWTVGTNVAYLLKGTSSLTYIKSSGGSVGTSVLGPNTIVGGVKMTIGYRNDSTSYLNGRIVELAMFSGQPSAADELAIWTSLNTRFGTPIPP